FFFSSRRRHTRSKRDWSSDVCSSDLDVAPLYGLLSVQGPRAEGLIAELRLFHNLPGQAFGFVKVDDTTLGEVYLMNQPRLETAEIGRASCRERGEEWEGGRACERTAM